MPRAHCTGLLVFNMATPSLPSVATTTVRTTQTASNKLSKLAHAAAPHDRCSEPASRPWLPACTVEGTRKSSMHRTALHITQFLGCTADRVYSTLEAGLTEQTADVSRTCSALACPRYYLARGHDLIQYSLHNQSAIMHVHTLHAYTNCCQLPSTEHSRHIHRLWLWWLMLDYATRCMPA
jgi:hypothetical protein